MIPILCYTHYCLSNYCILLGNRRFSILFYSIMKETWNRPLHGCRSYLGGTRNSVQGSSIIAHYRKMNNLPHRHNMWRVLWSVLKMKIRERECKQRKKQIVFKTKMISSFWKSEKSRNNYIHECSSVQ